MDMNLVGEALKFMALGMGIVFAFLIIMVFALKAQALLVAKYLNDDTVVSKTTQKQSTNDKDIVAAITGAIMYHNQQTDAKN
jgi:oxaloacetate decarboxylase gamma subunit